MASLSNKKVAIITEDGFEESELLKPKQALEDAGAKVHIISSTDKVKGWDHDHWSVELKADANIKDADPASYDGLLIPGGVINPDKMRENDKFIRFAKHFLEEAKPLGAICHGPQLLIETGLLRGRKMTSYKSIRTDLENAGVSWEDKEVIVDKGMVTSRNPGDIPAFSKKLIEEIAEGRHQPA